jgi:hypothetical protein
MNPSKSVNLQLSIEQVNHEAENAVSSYWLNRSSPQPPLDNVVDPNTEFKVSKIIRYFKMHDN